MENLLGIMLVLVAGAVALHAFDLEIFDDPENQRMIWTGHRRPDCDSIASAIGAAVLYGGRAAISGQLSGEAQFLLKECGLPTPPQLSELKAGTIGLVDHNETTQIPPGIAAEQVQAIIDHHGLTGSSLQTGAPIAVDIRPWCACASIVADRFFKSKRPLPPEVAKLLLGGILSDSKALRSKSVTPREHEIVRQLAAIAGVKDIAAFGRRMLEVKSDLSNYSAEEVIHSDYKEYEMNGKKVGIGLAETLNPAPLLARRDELAARLAELKRQDQLDHLLFGVKDIENGALYLIVADSADQTAVKRAFSDFLGETRRGWLVLTKTSRKKALVPAFNREMTRTTR